MDRQPSPSLHRLLYQRINGDVFEDVEADDEQELREHRAARDVFFAELDAIRRRTAARHSAQGEVEVEVAEVQP